MKTYEGLFTRAEEKLRQDGEYRLDEFFLDVIENITVAMKEAGKNKSEMAKALGVTPGRVSNFLSGRQKNPEFRTIVQYAIALGVEPHDLCARRKTREMREQPLFAIPGGYEEADITTDVANDDPPIRDTISA